MEVEMKFIYVFFFFCIALSLEVYSNEINYKFQKGDILEYQIACKITTSEGGYGKDGSEWETHRPIETKESFAVEVPNLSKEENGTCIYTLDFKGPFYGRGAEKERSFVIKMTDKGIIKYSNDQEEKTFLSPELSNGLFIGFVFPQLSEKEIKLDEEFDSPDINYLWHKKYNQFFSGLDIFVDKLKVTSIDNSKNTITFEGSKKSEYIKNKTKYNISIKRSYIFDSKKGIIIQSNYVQDKNEIDETHERRPFRSSEIWEVKLVKMNGKEIK
jgi:hypothetical protein